jgi:hypothetical protein
MASRNEKKVERETRDRALPRVLVGRTVTKTEHVAKKARSVPVPDSEQGEVRAGDEV